MTRKEKKIIAILPAYNAEKTLERTLDDIPKDWVDDIILVDDASKDDTVSLAKSLGLRTIVHEKNRGYGGNQKTCYRAALKEGADIVIMIHPDHQYDPTVISELLEPIIEGRADAVFGSRMIKRKNALAGGMPYWKFVANIVLTWVENLAFGTKLTEYHSGFRAYSKKLLTQVPFEKNSDDFVFDTEIIVQIKIAGLRILEVPIRTRYFEEASSIGLKRSIQYGVAILRVIGRYWLFCLGLRIYAQFAEVVRSKS